MKRITALATASALACTGIVALAPAAFAKDGDMKARGACSPSSSTWVAKAKSRDGGQRAEFYVKNNTVGQTWTFTLTQGGKAVGSPVTKTTRASDDQGIDDNPHVAEVKFRTFVSGGGQLVFTATNGSQTCTATLG